MASISLKSSGPKPSPFGAPDFKPDVATSDWTTFVEPRVPTHSGWIVSRFALKKHTPSAMYVEGAFHAYSVGRGRRTSLFVGLVAAATTATTLTTEAIAAVDGPVAAGQERYRGLIAAFCANH